MAPQTIRNVNMWQVSVLATFVVLFSFVESLSVLRVPPADDSSIQVCDPNEFFDPCSGCEATCTNPGPIVCRRICIRPGRCRCVNGYVRSSEGECIKPEECPGEATTDQPAESTSESGGSGDLECGDDEYLNDCGGCDGTCENPNPVCIALCGKPACRCSTGYVRHGGKCIPAELCPPPNLTRM
ncbi:SWM-1 protein [Aphelenchoides avenae]|nr:SWM-1 protein [Aphelenchus avenae]